jgi:hypothetical protein
MFLANTMKKFLLNYLDDMLLLAGCGCILYGLALWSIVITWIVAGLMLIGLGVLVGKVKSHVAK